MLVQIGLRMGAAVVAGAVLAGCSSPLTVSKDALQTDIAQRLTNAGAKPKSVTCHDDLIGVAGRGTRCEVVLSARNAFEAVVTVSGIQGDLVNYDMKPGLSKDQLQASVATLVQQATGDAVTSVDCESGLEGDSGTDAHCWVDAGGLRVRRTVEVKTVRGLVLSYDLVPLMTKTQVEASLLDQLGEQTGQRPDSAACGDSLEGRVGVATDCAVTVGGETKTYTLTVTKVEGSKINFGFQPKG